MSLGILAGAGGNWRLAQTAGQQVARRMLYAGTRLTAADALAAGLVDEVADDPAAAAAIALAGKITRQSWRALELTTLALRSHRPATTTFDMAAQALLFESQDKHDRMTAFLNRRRTPVSRTAAPGKPHPVSRITVNPYDQVLVPAMRAAPAVSRPHWTGILVNSILIGPISAVPCCPHPQAGPMVAATIRP